MSRRRVTTVTAAIAVTALAVLPTLATQPASAHATLMLMGEHARVNQIGSITMRIPHGCNGSLATTRLAINFGPAWRAVVPLNVAGWRKSTSRASNGVTTATWVALGAGLPGHATGDFKLRVRFPARANLYSLATVQTCGSTNSIWNQPDLGGADGVHPYPADFPIPKIRVRW